MLIDGIGERILYRLVRRTAVLKEGGVVIILCRAALGKAECNLRLQLIFGKVFSVLTLRFKLPESDRRGRDPIRDLGDIIRDTALVEIFGFLKLTRRRLVFQNKTYARIDKGLAAQRGIQKAYGNVDLLENVQIGEPADHRASALSACGDRLFLERSLRLAFFEFHGGKRCPIIGGNGHICTGILRCGCAKAVQAKRKLVGRACIIVVVFSARIKLAEYELPVIALFLLIISERNAASEVLHLNGKIQKLLNDNTIAVALSRLVHRVGKNLKKGMLTALKIVRSEDNGRALSDALRTLQGFDTGVIIFCCFGRSLCHLRLRTYKIS